LGRRRQREIGRRQQAGGRSSLKDMGQMRLATAGRAMNGKAGAGPIGPAVEPGDRRLIAGCHEKILAAEGGAVA